MEATLTLIKKFDKFIKRSFIPSTTFVMFFLLFDIFLNNKLFLCFLIKEHSNMTIVLTLLILISLSNFLSIINQYIYDDKIKGNYDGRYFFRHNNSELKRLRKEVKSDLKKEKETDDEYLDYSLYQIIGKKMNNLDKDIKTERYVDEAKSIGITFLSIILVTTLSIIRVSIDDIYWITLIFVLIPIIYFIGFELIKSRYRTRAIRIYTNYIDEMEKLDKAKEGESNE